MTMPSGFVGGRTRRKPRDKCWRSAGLARRPSSSRGHGGSRTWRHLRQTGCRCGVGSQGTRRQVDDGPVPSRIDLSDPCPPANMDLPETDQTRSQKQRRPLTLPIRSDRGPQFAPSSRWTEPRRLLGPGPCIVDITRGRCSVRRRIRQGRIRSDSPSEDAVECR
jgi:hypothetical protein